MKAKSSKRIFVDLDGVLAEFRYGTPFSELYRKGYFESLRPNGNILEAVRRLTDDPSLDIYVLSAVLMDSEYAYSEKISWLDRNLPEVDMSHRIFVPCQDKADKSEYIKDISEGDLLIDDYGENLRSWKAKTIKVSRNEKDRIEEAVRFGKAISPFTDPEEIIATIKEVI